MPYDSTDQARQDGAESLPPLNALRHFKAVARLGSFAAAAKDLHVTHWAVGKQIRLLEDWFGVPLFERRARGVVPTDEGIALLGDVDGAFARLGRSVARLRQSGQRGAVHRISGVVRVNSLSSFALCWLIPRLSDFQAQYPEIEVRLTTTSRKLRYVGDAFDIGVRSGPEEASGLLSIRLMPDWRLPACHPSILQGQPILSLDDLRHHTLLHSTSTRLAWSQWLKNAATAKAAVAAKVANAVQGETVARATLWKGQRHLHFDHVYLQLAAAVSGLGVALASLPLIDREVAAGRLVCPLSLPAWRGSDYMLIVNADSANDSAVMAFKQWIIAASKHVEHESMR